MIRRVLARRIAVLFLIASVSTPQEPPAKKPSDWKGALPASLRPFRKNFILLSYDPHLGQLGSSVADGDNKDMELKFQLSLRFGISGESSGLYFAYTGLSHWQVFDVQHSAPFRTTDHEPELFWEQQPGDLGYRLGFVHQSNGEGGTDSRSWNRIYVEGLWKGVDDFEAPSNRWGLSLKLWDAVQVADENPDIDDYLGNFELRGEWLLPLPGKQFVSCALRNNLERDNRGSLELDYSLAFLGNLRLLFQYFNGYGESLLEYNEYAHRVSAGFEFSP